MNNWYKNLPQKRMGAGVFFLNAKGEVLVVKPSYKDHWSVPGGVVDENESPRDACVREVKEELGIDVNRVDMLCLDYMPTDGEKNESLQFVFYGGILSEEQISAIKLDGKELVELKFVLPEEAIKLWGKNMAKRAPECFNAIKTGSSIYLENGEFAEVAKSAQ